MVVNPGRLDVRLRLARLLGDRDRGLALLRYAGHGGEQGRDMVDAVFAAANEGSPVALRAFAEVGRWLGLGLASLVNVFNPGLVVLGTQLARMYPYTHTAMLREFDARALRMSHDLVRVVPRPPRHRRPAAGRRRGRLRPAAAIRRLGSTPSASAAPRGSGPHERPRPALTHPSGAAAPGRERPVPAGDSSAGWDGRIPRHRNHHPPALQGLGTSGLAGPDQVKEGSPRTTTR